MPGKGATKTRERIWSVEYASRIWATGGQAELHIWGGGCHGFDIYAPDSELTRAALPTRDSWLRRILGT